MNKRLVTTLCIGDEAHSLRKAAIPLMESYAERCHADFIVLDTTDSALNSEAFYEKFQIRGLLDQYERVLYIDLDILVSPKSPDLFKVLPQDVFGATSVETVLSKVPEERQVIKQCLGDVEWKAPYFNAGVMMFGQSAKPMLDFCIDTQAKWVEFMRTTGVKAFYDQTLLNYSLNFNGPTFFDLGRSFNFTRAWKQFENRFSQNFIHYAGLTGNRDWQMFRDYQIFCSKYRFWLYRTSPAATWIGDRLSAIMRRFSQG